jgi:hypothetical protein
MPDGWLGVQRECLNGGSTCPRCKESPEVVDAADAVIGGLEKDRQDGVGETDKILVGGLSIDGEEERLGCCEG